MDLISEILRGLRLKGAVFVDARLTEPWSIAINVTPEDCLRFMERPAGIICYHAVIDGAAFVSAGGALPTRVSTGGVVLLPQNDPHVLSSAPGIPPIPAETILRRIGAVGAATIDYGGGGERTHLVCGFLAGDTAAEPLLAVLPRVLHADLREGAAQEWVSASVRFAAEELAAGRMASSVLMTHLSETLLIEAIRQYCVSVNAETVAWVQAARDPQIGRALALIHQAPLAVDGRPTCPRGGAVTQRLPAPVHGADVPSAHRLCRGSPDQPRESDAEGHHPVDRSDRRAFVLPLGGSLQPSLQARRRCRSKCLAPGSGRNPVGFLSTKLCT